MGGVVVFVEGPENVAQVLPPPCASVILMRFLRGSPGEAFLAPEADDGGVLQGTPAGHPPSWWGICLLVFLMEAPSCPPLGQLAGQQPSSQP